MDYLKTAFIIFPLGIGFITAGSFIPCKDPICENGGTCYMLNNKSMCTCPQKWTGSLCTNDLDPCEPNPCAHNGTCVENQGNKDGVDCNCTRYYAGPKCEEYDPCAFDPCQNGGICNATTEDDFECLCTERYEGDRCGVDKCDSIVCQNGGRCLIRNMNPTCNCINGFRGAQCRFGYNRYKVRLIASPTIDHLQFHADLLNQSTERYNQSSLDVSNAFESLCPSRCQPIQSVSFTKGSIKIEVYIDVDYEMKTTAFLQMVVVAIDDKSFLPYYNVSSDSVEIEDESGDILHQSQYILKSLCTPFDDFIRIEPKKEKLSSSKRATLQIAIDTEDIPEDISACACVFDITNSNKTKLLTEFSLQNRSGDEVYTDSIEFISCNKECCDIYIPNNFTSDWFKTNRIDGKHKLVFKLKQGAPDIYDILKLHVLNNPALIELSCGVDLNIDLPKACPSKIKPTKTAESNGNENVLDNEEIWKISVVLLASASLIFIGIFFVYRAKVQRNSESNNLPPPIEPRPESTFNRNIARSSINNREDEYAYISDFAMDWVLKKSTDAQYLDMLPGAISTYESLEIGEDNHEEGAAQEPVVQSGYLSLRNTDKPGG